MYVKYMFIDFLIKYLYWALNLFQRCVRLPLYNGEGVFMGRGAGGWLAASAYRPRCPAESPRVALETSNVSLNVIQLRYQAENWYNLPDTVLFLLCVPFALSRITLQRLMSIIRIFLSIPSWVLASFIRRVGKFKVGKLDNFPR